MFKSKTNNDTANDKYNDNNGNINHNSNSSSSSSSTTTTTTTTSLAKLRIINAELVPGGNRRFM